MEFLTALLLLEDGYLHRKKRVAKTTEYWSCVEVGCHARVNVNVPDNTIKSKLNGHNHAPKTTYMKAPDLKTEYDLPTVLFSNGLRNQ